MLLVTALELEGGGLSGNEALEICDLFRVHAVIDGGEFFFGAFDCGLGLLFVDLVFAERAVGEHLDHGLADFGKSGSDGKFAFGAVVAVAKDAWLECGDESRVHWQHTHFAIGSGEVDGFNRCGEDLFLRGDDVEMQGHGNKK